MPIQIPTSWTSTGLDWTAPDPMWPLELLNPCIIEAIKEKYLSLGLMPAAGLINMAYEPMRPNWHYVSQISICVDDLISRFINHTDHEGDWNGQTIIPNWTINSILSDIGDLARIHPEFSQRSGVFIPNQECVFDSLSSWYFQTRKILDMLRWVKKTLTPTTYEQRVPSALTWYPEFFNEAVLTFNSSPVVWATTGNTYLAEHHFAIFPYNCAIGRRRSTINTLININFDTLNDVYLFFELGDSGSVYENNDYIGTTRNSLFKHISDTQISANNNINFMLGNFGNSTLSSENVSWKISSGVIISKYDGPNGFKFRADSPST